MQVFVTGASGLVGSALVPKLVEAGYTVTALSRSEKSDAKLQQLGATTVVRGTTTDVGVLKETARKADAVIHLAFNHDMTAQPGGYLTACDEDRAAITAMADGLITDGPGKVFIYTTGTLTNLGPDEKCQILKLDFMPRYLSEELVQSYVIKGLRSVLVRLPPVVHGRGFEHQFLLAQIAVAKRTDFAGYIDDGTNVWCSTNVKDVASCIVLALSKAPSGYLHAVDEEGIPVKEIAQFIGKKLDVPTKSVPKEEASAHFGYIGEILGLGQKTTADYTKEVTGWKPEECCLFEDLEHYSCEIY